MALNKVTYVDGATVVYADNLNAIQDAIIELENGGGGGGGTTNYNALSNKPQIGGVTLEGNKTLAQIGAGTYSKPSGGIPKSDLASAVQTSLGKADTALQSAPVTSVNGQTGVVSLTIPATASDVGAVAANQGVANAGKFLIVANDGTVTPITVPSAQGVNF